MSRSGHRNLTIQDLLSGTINSHTNNIAGTSSPTSLVDQGLSRRRTTRVRNSNLSRIPSLSNHIKSHTRRQQALRPATQHATRARLARLGTTTSLILTLRRTQHHNRVRHTPVPLSHRISQRIHPRHRVTLSILRKSSLAIINLRSSIAQLRTNHHHQYSNSGLASNHQHLLNTRQRRSRNRSRSHRSRIHRKADSNSGNTLPSQLRIRMTVCDIITLTATSFIPRHIRIILIERTNNILVTYRTSMPTRQCEHRTPLSTTLITPKGRQHTGSSKGTLSNRTTDTHDPVISRLIRHRRSKRRRRRQRGRSRGTSRHTGVLSPIEPTSTSTQRPQPRYNRHYRQSA